MNVLFKGALILYFKLKTGVPFYAAQDHINEMLRLAEEVKIEPEYYSKPIEVYIDYLKG